MFKGENTAYIYVMSSGKGIKYIKQTCTQKNKSYILQKTVNTMLPE